MIANDVIVTDKDDSPHPPPGKIQGASYYAFAEQTISRCRLNSSRT
jgi:hypothetical protein